ncbi:MAG: alpha/beta fold hydrolase [Acidimicrobiia bacterium]
MTKTEPVPTASDQQSEATMLGPVPLVPLGRPQVAAAARLVEHGLRHPLRVARGGLALTGELAAVARGTSTRAPAKGDRRFADPVFTDNPIYRRVAQGYLAATGVAGDTVGRLGLDPKSEERAQFLVGQLADALAPTNTLAGNPAALRKARATRGTSVVAGARNLAGDVLRNGGMPTTVDSRPFVVGETVGVSPGAVVFRDEVAELIQYQPTTPQVLSRPVVIIPPEISRHYILDLSPGRSLVEYLVSQGHQVFVLSFRNPTPEQRDWNLDTYIATAEDAIAAACRITKSPDVHLVGACAGGVTTSALAGHLAATGDRRMHDLTLLVTVLDTAAETMASLFLSEWSASMAVRASKRKGMLPGRQLSRMFAWMRPNDLVWNYWVNNYLLGNDPPAFDILAWNADMPNMSAGLHADFAALFLENPLVEPGGLSVLGTPIDLAKIDQDAYVVAALTDHITPWQACHRSVGMLGGSTRFVLSSSGHIQAIVNPPTNPKASYWATDDPAGGPDAFLAGADKYTGSWWVEWSEWLTTRGGPEQPAPTKLGARGLPVLDPAPGPYVRS